MKDTVTGKSWVRSLFSGLLPLFVMAHLGHHLITSVTVPLLPMIRSDFSLDYTKAGLVVSAFSVPYGISQLPSGWLTDRVGARIMVTIGICGVAVAGFLVGLSHTYIMLLVFLALMGVLGGAYHPAAPSMISASVEPKKLGRALGLHLIGGNISFFLSPLTAAAIAAVWGWRGAYTGLAIPALIFGIIFYLLLGSRQPQNRPGIKSPITEVETSPASRRLRRLIIFLILTTFTQAVLSATTNFIPLFLVDHFGVSKETAAASLSLIYSTGLWAGPLGGYLADRWDRVSIILAVCLLAGPTIYLLNLATYGLSIVALLLIIGIIMSVRMPVSEAYIVDQSSVRYRSTMLGVYFFGAMEGGGVLTPIMGYLIDHFGFYTSFNIAAGAVFMIAAICSVLLRASRD